MGLNSAWSSPAPSPPPAISRFSLSFSLSLGRVRAPCTIWGSPWPEGPCGGGTNRMGHCYPPCLWVPGLGQSSLLARVTVQDCVIPATPPQSLSCCALGLTVRRRVVAQVGTRGHFSHGCRRGRCPWDPLESPRPLTSPLSSWTGTLPVPLRASSQFHCESGCAVLRTDSLLPLSGKCGANESSGER